MREAVSPGKWKLLLSGEERKVGRGWQRKIRFQPDQKPRCQEEEMEWGWTERRASGALERALGWEGESCVTVGKSP